MSYDGANARLLKFCIPVANQLNFFLKKFYKNKKISFNLYFDFPVSCTVQVSFITIFVGFPGTSEEAPKWNFYKYLVNHNGLVINVWGSQVDPEDVREDIQRAILETYKHEGSNRDEF